MWSSTRLEKDFSFLSTEGLAFQRVDEDGLHFRGAAGEGFRYGHATWIDAGGARRPVPARFESGEIRLTVSAELVQASRFPAVLDPVVTPETDVGKPVYLSAGGSEDYLAVGWSGTTYLVVWRDERMAYSGELLAERLYGARISADGKVLDPGGLMLDPGGKMTHPGQLAVASNGKNFLVGWVGNSGGNHLHAVRVGLDGMLLDGGTDLTPSSYVQHPSLASDGNDYLVVWHDGDYEQERVKAARIASDGTVSVSPSPIAAGSENQMSPSVTFGSGTYLLTYWSRSSQMVARLVPTGGAISAGPPIIVATGYAFAHTVHRSVPLVSGGKQPSRAQCFAGELLRL